MGLPKNVHHDANLDHAALQWSRAITSMRGRNFAHFRLGNGPTGQYWKPQRGNQHWMQVPLGIVASHPQGQNPNIGAVDNKVQRAAAFKAVLKASMMTGG